MKVERRYEELAGRMKAGETFDYEAMLERHYRSWVQPGDTVVDVGAHAGRHFGPLLELVGPTGQAIGFEPIPQFFSLTAEKYAAKNAHLHNLALSDAAGRAQFTFARNAAGMSGFIWRTIGAPDDADIVMIDVEVAKLDDFTATLSGISFVKVDVEGAEIACLHGGEETVRNNRPVIAVEYGKPTYSLYGLSKFDLHDFCIERNYNIFDVFMNNLTDRDEWDAGCDSIVWDFILVPNEKLQQFQRSVVETFSI